MLMYLRVRHVVHAFVVLVFVFLAAPLRAQTIDDGVMMGKHNLQTGNLYSYESWDEYWEGAQKRTNGNVGTVTTKTNIWSANYGVTDRLNVIAMVPYVWTHCSQGVLHGFQGFQDITVAAKYSVLEKASPNYGMLRAIAVVSAGIPLAEYNVELLPLSIGNGSKRVSSRGTLFFHTTPGWFVNGSTAYTWRAEVRLDRPYYYTDDTFVMSDHADMPNVADYVVSAGYMRGGLMAAGSFSQQRTLGGGDIRRQDMPFVSNRMNFSKAGATVMAPIPKLRVLSFHLSAAYTFDGRNVGQATSVTGGILYNFQGGPTQ